MAWLYWVGHSATLSTVEDFSGIPKGTLAYQGARGPGVLNGLTDALYELLVEGKHDHVRPQGEIHMPQCMAELRQAIVELRAAGMPGCIGAVDGTLVPIPAIPASRLRCVNGMWKTLTSWWCYKKHYAWLVLAVVNARGEYIYVKNNVPGAQQL